MWSNLRQSLCSNLTAESVSALWEGLSYIFFLPEFMPRQPKNTTFYTLDRVRCLKFHFYDPLAGETFNIVSHLDISGNIHCLSLCTSPCQECSHTISYFRNNNPSTHSFIHSFIHSSFPPLPLATPPIVLQTYYYFHLNSTNPLNWSNINSEQILHSYLSLHPANSASDLKKSFLKLIFFFFFSQSEQ